MMKRRNNARPMQPQQMKPAAQFVDGMVADGCEDAFVIEFVQQLGIDGGLCLARLVMTPDTLARFAASFEAMVTEHESQYGALPSRRLVAPACSTLPEA